MGFVSLHNGYHVQHAVMAQVVQIPSEPKRSKKKYSMSYTSSRITDKGNDSTQAREPRSAAALQHALLQLFKNTPGHMQPGQHHINQVVKLGQIYAHRGVTYHSTPLHAHTHTQISSKWKTRNLSNQICSCFDICTRTGACQTSMPTA
jgi:hypothetical protein